MNINIYGERNSGTIYLMWLLKRNIQNLVIKVPNIRQMGYYERHRNNYKHNIPEPERVKDKNTIFFFIFRDLDSWLNSMYHRPYGILGRNSLHEFITTNIELDVHKNSHSFYKDQENKNLFQIRYFKYKKYLEFNELINYSVFVNLNWLQKNSKLFIDLICQHFNLQKYNKFTEIFKHTKTMKCEQNDFSYTRYPINHQKYKDYIDQDIEHKINDLTILIKNLLQ